MRRALALLFIALVIAVSMPAFGREDKSVSEVKSVLDAQVEAWNRHDLDGFMRGYWNSPETTFFSGAKMLQGWQATLDRYRKTYNSAGHEMGKLVFSNLNIEILGKNAAFARGEWHLTMPDGKSLHGVFTLIFRKMPEGWKIVHDHTSAAEAVPTETQ